MIENADLKTSATPDLVIGGVEISQARRIVKEMEIDPDEYLQKSMAMMNNMYPEIADLGRLTDEDELYKPFVKKFEKNLPVFSRSAYFTQDIRAEFADFVTKYVPDPTADWKSYKIEDYKIEMLLPQFKIYRGQKVENKKNVGGRVAMLSGGIDFGHDKGDAMVVELALSNYEYVIIAEFPKIFTEIAHAGYLAFFDYWQEKMAEISRLWQFNLRATNLITHALDLHRIDVVVELFKKLKGVQLDRPRYLDVRQTIADKFERLKRILEKLQVTKVDSKQYFKDQFSLEKDPQFIVGIVGTEDKIIDYRQFMIDIGAAFGIEVFKIPYMGHRGPLISKEVMGKLPEPTFFLVGKKNPPV